MKNLSNIKFLKALAPLILLLILTGKVYSQRCGDGILFSFTDNSNTAIQSSQLKISGYYYDSYYWDKDAKVKPGMKLKYPEYYQVQKDTIYISKLEQHVDWKDSGHFYIRTFCSMLLMRVKAVYQNKLMQIDIYNIPGDMPLKIDNIPFSEGKYELNLSGIIDDKLFPKSSDGYYNISFVKFQSAE